MINQFSLISLVPHITLIRSKFMVLNIFLKMVLSFLSNNRCKTMNNSKINWELMGNSPCLNNLLSNNLLLTLEFLQINNFLSKEDQILKDSKRIAHFKIMHFHMEVLQDFRVQTNSFLFNSKIQCKKCIKSTVDILKSLKQLRGCLLITKGKE
jgi:hypothetical protein